LRSKLPGLLNKCELLMKVGDEYRIQTEESTAWNDEFLSQRNQLANEAHRIESERSDRLRRTFGELVKRLSLTQGNSKVTRDIHPIFDSQLPSDNDKKTYLWIRDGWSIDENSVRVEARQAGNQSPTIFVFIPKRSADDLRHHLIDYKAASATLDKRGVPNTPEGSEARSAMETTRQAAEGKIRELLNDAFSGARVFQGGGNEILGNNLQEMVLEASGNSLKRLFPQFDVADHSSWDKVYSRAKQGAPDALKAVGYEGEPVNNPVCKAILGVIAGGKKGADIRAHFEGAPYGWSGDAVDGGIQVLLVAGQIRAQDERGQTIDPKDLERKALGKALLKVESTTVTTAQRIQIRKLLQKVGLQAKQGEESLCVPEFLQKMQCLADSAGGEAPKPARPDSKPIDEIRLLSGNEQLLSLYNQRDELAQLHTDWKEQTEKIEKRWPSWLKLKELLGYAENLPDAEVYIAQKKNIEDQRFLLAEPDFITPMVSSVVQLLREELNRLDAAYSEKHEEGMLRLGKDNNWIQLEPEQKNNLLGEQLLTLKHRPEIRVQTTEDILATLNKFGLSSLRDRVIALPGRFEQIIVQAAELLEPKAQFIAVPRRTLKTEDDIDAWVEEVKVQLKAALDKGPIVIR